jgi:hypothetical protein
MEYQNHLYLILSPNQALITSQVDPVEFAKHYGSGTTRYYQGKVIFAELDVNFRNPYFNMEAGLAALKPHPDGRPKATKYISCYRVLEHIDFSAIKTLYLTTPEGYCIGLKEAPYDKTHHVGFLRIFAEIAPLRMLVMSSFNFAEFGKYITDPEYGKGAPKLFYTQIELDTDEFLADLEARPTMTPPIPGLHPSKLRDAINELKNTAEAKNTKGLSLDNSLEQIPYKRFRHGFMFASQNETKFFPIPSPAKIEQMNPKFWRTM